MTLDELIQAVKVLYPSALRINDYTAVTDTAGNASLSLWNNALGAQPTEAQLADAISGIQLATARQAQSALIAGACANATYNQPVAYMGTTFWADEQSQFMLVAAVVGFMQAGAVPAGFQWWDATGAPVAMTLAQLQGLYQATMTMFQTNFIKRKTLQAQITAAATVAAVQAIVW